MRPFLVQPEQERLKSLEHKLDSPEALAEAIGEILPQATVASQRRGEELTSAMKPVMLSIIRDIVRTNPQLFAEAIFPSIGPAIRKAVRATLEEFVRRVDDIVERTMSIESLKWRIEAARTGRPFVDVVLLHNLVYRVEHVFLMHRETGLVLQHVAAEDVSPEDPHQVSAMLTAIDDFARDAFREKDGGLSRFRVGELTGIVEHGPRAVLVAIVRGVATREVEQSLDTTLELINSQYAADLEQFKGEVAPFASTYDALLGCMREERIRRPMARRRGLIALASMAIILVTAALIGGRILHEHRRHFTGYVEEVAHEPGVSITRIGRHGSRQWVEGLADPLARDPAALLSSHGLGPSDVELRFKPIVSLEPPLVERRALQVLRPPSGVSLRLVGGTLVASGIADRAWIDRERLLATSLPGVEALDDTSLFEAEAITTARAAADALEGTEISFPMGSTQVPPAERARLDAAARAVEELLSVAPRGGLSVQIEVLGHADATGAPEKNEPLSEARAESVAAMLADRGIVPEKLSIRGLGQAEPAARKVTFAVRLSPAGGGP